MRTTQTTCIVCHSSAKVLMNGQILQKYDIHYYFCGSCKCIFTEKPYWISEAYHESIAVTDTGIMLRNLEVSRDLFAITKRYFNPQTKMLDYGGGYGILTRMLRDKGVDVYWSDRYSKNILAKGFEYDGRSKVDVVLAFEVVEHLENPVDIIREIMTKSDCFIFSVSTLPKFNFKTNNEWWYFSPETGQHIFFPSKETLQWIANEIGCKYYKLLGFHIFSKKKTFPFIRSLDLTFVWIIRQIQKKFFKGRRFKSKVWADNSTLKNRLKNDTQKQTNN